MGSGVPMASGGEVAVLRVELLGIEPPAEATKQKRPRADPQGSGSILAALSANTPVSVAPIKTVRSILRCGFDRNQSQFKNKNRPLWISQTASTKKIASAYDTEAIQFWE
jgi:hypothetical protein